VEVKTMNVNNHINGGEKARETTLNP